jgi:hypothetical protein
MKLKLKPSILKVNQTYNNSINKKNIFDRSLSSLNSSRSSLNK